MKIITNNKKAYHEFFVSNTLEAGISLEGDEVKSVREGGVSLIDAFVTIKMGRRYYETATSNLMKNPLILITIADVQEHYFCIKRKLIS